MSKKIIIGFIILLVVILAGSFAYQVLIAPEEIGEKEVSPKEITKANAKTCKVNSDCAVFGKDGDCNCGCFNKMYQWKGGGDCFCAAPTSCECVEGRCENVFGVKKETSLKQLFVDKYNRDISEIIIDIEREKNGYIKGGVKLKPGNYENSGMFLAAKIDGKWELVYDGNGAIPCSSVKPYDFPVNMVVECFSENTGEIKEIAKEVCVGSGGRVVSNPCCKSIGDYPDLCLVGACGCSPEKSHQVKVCDCGEDKCFNGDECVDREGE